MGEQSPLKGAIARRLRLAREQAGLSQGQVAKLLGLHRPSISEAEAGRRSVTAEEVSQMARLYNVSGSWLTCSEEEGGNEKEDKLRFAARELKKVKPEDVDRLLSLLASLRGTGHQG